MVICLKKIIMVLNTVSTKTLGKIAVYGAFGLSTTGMILQWRVKENLKKNDFYQDALKIIKTNPAAKSVLGEPIRDGSFVLDSRINKVTDTDVKFQLPVRGSKERGTLYFQAHRDSVSDKWNINKMELELKNDNTRRLVLRNETNQ